MGKTIINLTLPFLVKLIEEVLETYPQYPYQQAFANPDMRQYLIAYVLSRVSSCYVVVDENKQQQWMNPNLLHYCTEQTIHIENTVRKGIEEIMCKHSEQVRRQIPTKVEACVVPSYWFG